MQHGLEMAPADPPALAVPHCAVVARHRLVQLDAAVPLVRTEFLNERELVTPS